MSLFRVAEFFSTDVGAEVSATAAIRFTATSRLHESQAPIDNAPTTSTTSMLMMDFSNTLTESLNTMIPRFRVRAIG